MATKRSRPSPPPTPPPPANDVSLLDAFATRGWVCIRNLLSPPELRVLQDECNALYARQSAEAIAAQGCVLDVMAQCPMGDSDSARVDSKCYLAARSKQLKSIADGQQGEVFTSLLFEKLPTITAQLLAGCTDTEPETQTDVFFFNEHYVVKPPKSHVEFRWHRDDDEQLAMCVHRDTIVPYVSAWCALDDATEANGALQFVSLDESAVADEEHDVGILQRRASELVSAGAGDVLFFLSSVWHCSSSNESDAPRRAFYAQYSRERITARPKDADPLSFAIPCTARTTLSRLIVDNGGDSRSCSKKLKFDVCEAAEGT
ncbi:Phytanoyl-CoA dioxygenase [Phytophthora cinnamomi]|uniref:Phytanoyl-CoA dioxygenase n=1 Tax=Phytophthora cinnamomi TaxID=4785 RepID=UPI00355ABAB0|nr:Phytanoyl-CoA dioxygenase [Phytophthora cinnamomi]